MVSTHGPPLRAPALAVGVPGLSDAVVRFLNEVDPATPCLVIDLAVVAARYRALQQALPEAPIYYAVKANPDVALLRVLVDLGSRFDVASRAEVDACLAAGASPAAMSYGNTIKKEADIAYAYGRGVRLFACDSEQELDKLARAAPGSSVFCRILTSGGGADWPLSRKFGCDPTMASDLLVSAAGRGLDAVGVSFHVGSQQRDPGQWDAALGAAAAVFAAAAERGVALRMVNLGGGFPAHYSDPVPPISSYATAIRRSVTRHFPLVVPSLIIEPGRYIAGDSGTLLAEVVLVSRKSDSDPVRWVYLDVGIFGGLSEALNEAIRYQIRTARDGGPRGPAILAGPTCDSLDVLYERNQYQLPLDLGAGDRVAILHTGAYTHTYCSVGFNGFPPLQAYCI